MARKPTGNPPGAPLKDINWKQFERLCAMLCTQEEIAGFFQVSVDTLSDRARRQYGEGYSEVYKKLSQAGKLSLRRNQFVLSKTNAAMAIWLGKIWLGQRDYDDKNLSCPNDELLDAKTALYQALYKVQELEKEISMLKSAAIKPGLIIHN